MNNRRGFTLIELLLSLFMMVVVAGGLYSLMVTVYRVTRKHTEISNLQGNLRTGFQLLQSELQEIYTDAAIGDSDINGVLTAGTIDYWAMRGFGETCGITPGGGAVQIRQGNYGGRAPVATRDHLLLFQDRDTLTASDDNWLKRPIVAVAEGTCTTLPATPSWDLTVPSLLATDLVEPVGGVDPWVFAPGPVRTVEQMELGLINDAGKDWMGIRSISGGEAALIPVIGPLTGTGVQFRYFDGASAETAVNANVKRIQVTLWGIGGQLVNTGMGSTVGDVRDSVIVRVQLRNSR